LPSMRRNSSINGKIVALLSDFGNRDGYAGIMKGVILSQDPGIRIIDLTHEIEPHNILSGAYVLYSAWSYLPSESIVCAVVDPGVGSGRATLVAQFDERTLIAPDNGLISLLVRMIPNGRSYALRLDSILELAENTSSQPLGSGRNRRPSNTFHGRDLFAPAAALCAAGYSRRIRGRAIEPVVLPEAMVERRSDGVSGKILHIDRFGNCISSVHSTDVAAIGSKPENPPVIQCGPFSENRICRTYTEVPVGEPLCLMGSSAFLEIAVREASAAERFGITQGQSIRVGAR
jgi:S-adenosyl-L-methionine hydrolase (adenosine-forming)